MKTYLVVYTTNKEDRFVTSVQAPDYTKAFLTFTSEHPAHYTIVDLIEKEN